MQSLNVVFTGQDEVEVRQEPVPKLGSNEVLVRACKTLVSSGTESIVLGRLFEPGTRWDDWVTYPFAPGYSLVGRVVATGSAVTHVREGDRVAVRAPHRQYVTAPATNLCHIPEGVSDEDATWFYLATIVQNGVRSAEQRLGEAVVVVGLGLLGQLVVQYARLLGAREVIAIDPADQRLNMARAHGATATLAAGVLEAHEDVWRLTMGDGADVVYEVTGVATVLPSALRLLRQFGRLLLLGDTGKPSDQRLTHDVLTKGLQIIGAHANTAPAASTPHAYWSHDRMAHLFFAYLLRGDMRVSDLITHRYGPSDASRAYHMLREERASAMGVIFDWTGM